MSNANRTAKNVYEIVTDQVIQQLESGAAPWKRPWKSEPPCNLVSGKAYRGINPFLLQPQGFASKYWLSFNQAKKLGGHIKAGSKASIITFWNIGPERLRVDAEGNERKSKPILLRYYSVFNLSQTEGIADKLGLDKIPPRVPDIDACERIVAEMPKRPMMEQSGRAWYKPSTDSIGMPAKGLFNSAEEFYSTLFHEMIHSTGHPNRIGREGIENLNEFGSETYSREELVAELGAAMLCGVTGIVPRTIENSTAYLKSWINVLKGDSKLIVQAASAAQKACDFVRNTSEKPEETSAVDAEGSI